MTRFLIIGDLHGNIPKIYEKEFDAIIAPGDFCSDSPRKYMFESLKRYLDNKEDIEWFDICGKRKAKSMVKKSLRDGRKILKKLNKLNVPVFALPGNWDWTGNEDWEFLDKNYWKDYLIKDLKNIKDCHKKVRKFKDLTIIGHGITSAPELPIHRIKRFSKKEFSKKEKKYQNKFFKPMDKKFRKIKDLRKTIFLSHNVPYKMKLDKVINKDSPMNGKHLGSYLAREIIEKYQPLVCIGGHIHEGFGKTKFKKTNIINAGFGSYVNTLLEIKDGKITKIELIENDNKIN